MKSSLSAVTLSLGVALGLGMSLAPVQAHQPEQRIFKAPASGFEPRESKRFAINPELGRAWVEVDLFYPSSEMTEHHRVPVQGLRYDSERAEVVFEARQQRVVCATVQERGWWLFKHHKVHPTGDCELTHQYVEHPTDNGFTVDHIEHFEVHFKAAPDDKEKG